jgi:hypothetical protein
MLSTVLIIVFMIATFEISLNGVYASNAPTTSEKQTVTVAAGGGNNCSMDCICSTRDNDKVRRYSSME